MFEKSIALHSTTRQVIGKTWGALVALLSRYRIVKRLPEADKSVSIDHTTCS
jgi:hypothetical protein